MIAKIIAYDGKIICCPLKTRQTKKFFPTDYIKGNMGCVLLDTAINLGVSKEAFNLMKTIPRNNDSCGDIDWWKYHNNKYAFSWFGGLFRVIDPAHAEADRDFLLDDNMPYTTISNTPPQGLRAALADATLSKWAIWKTPFAVGIILPEDYPHTTPRKN